MLLALDVGNSNTVIGLFRIGTDGEPSALVADWRITTPYKQTTDEIASQLQNLFTRIYVGQRSPEQTPTKCIGGGHAVLAVLGMHGDGKAAYGEGRLRRCSGDGASVAHEITRSLLITLSP